MAMQSGFIKRIRDIMRMDAGINGDAQRIEQMVWMLFLKVYDAKEDDWELNEDDYESIIPEDLRWRNWAKADENGHAMTGDKLLNFVNNTLFPVLKGNDVKEGDTIIYKGIHVTPDTPVKKAIVKSTFEDKDDERYCHIFIKGCSGEDYTGFFRTAGYIEDNSTSMCDSEQCCIFSFL